MDMLAPAQIPDALLNQHMAVLGMTGSGKTSTEKLTVEQVVAAGFRVCVLDTIKSDWWGITSSADGKKPGLPFKILGGPRGHLPLHSNAGKVIGQLVGAGKLPLSIIDMADFEPGGPQRFFVDFAQALWRHAKGVVYLVIEEAHEIAPKERAGFGAENMALHWAKKLATGSRTKGIRLIVATQRTQALHNAVLGSCGTLIAHRMVAPADQKPVIDWLSANTTKSMATEISGSLAGLADGTAWLCSSVAGVFERVALPKFKTFDNSRTPTGDSAEIDVKTAPVDQDELRALIGDALKDAEANDPKALKAKIADLERKLKQQPAPSNESEKSNVAGSTAIDARIARAEELSFQRGFYQGYEMGRDEGYKTGYRSGYAAGNRIAHEATVAALADLQAKAKASVKVDDSLIVVQEPKWPRGKPQLPAAVRVQPAEPPASTIGGSTPIPARPVQQSAAPVHSTLSKPQQVVVDAIAWWEAAGHGAPIRAQVAAVCGWNVTSGHLKNVLGSLKTLGLVDYPEQGRVSLHDAGRALANPAEGSLEDRLRKLLSSPQWQVFEALRAHGAEMMSRQDLADRLGWNITSGHLKNVLGSLRTLDIVTYPSTGFVNLTEWVLT